MRAPRGQFIPAKPASPSEVITDSGVESATLAEAKPDLRPGRSPSSSACIPYRDVIELGLSRGRNAMAIWQELVDTCGFASRLPERQAVCLQAAGKPASGSLRRNRNRAGRRSAGRLRRRPDGPRPAERQVSAHTTVRADSGLQPQVGSSAGVSAPVRRPGQNCTRKPFAGWVVLLAWLSSIICAKAFSLPTYTIPPSTRCTATCSGIMAQSPLPCRVGHPDRKGKVESGVGHAQKTPLKGLRFETLEEAQTYLDHWEERWADTRIHGTTKRQVAVMFAEERPSLLPLPVEPFRYYLYGERTVHLDGCVEVEAAYYSAPPGWIGRRVQVQWDSRQVRLLDPQTGQLLREHLHQTRGGHRIKDEDRSRKTPLGTQQLLCRADKAGSQIGALCRGMHQAQGEVACAALWAFCHWQEVRRGASRRRLRRSARSRHLRLPLRAPLSGAESATAAELAAGRSSDPATHAVSRLHRQQDQSGEQRMNLIELQRALGQLRLGGMATVLETRLRQAQAEAMAPIDLISCLVADELTRRSDRLLERRRKQAAFRDPHRTLDNFDFTFNPKMNRSLVFDLATCAFIGKREDALFLGPGGTGKSHLAQAIGQAAIQQGYRVLYRETHVLLDDLAEAVADGTRKEFMESLTTVPLLIIDDFGMRKLPMTAAEDLLEIVMRRYERASTLLTSNRPVEDWGKLLGDVAAVSAMLDRILHHGHVLKCGPRSWRTKSTGTAG